VDLIVNLIVVELAFVSLNVAMYSITMQLALLIHHNYSKNHYIAKLH
jgi:hypothetical protein